MSRRPAVQFVLGKCRGVGKDRRTIPGAPQRDDMRYRGGRSHVNIVARHAAELTALCRRYRVRRLELFGSVAAGRDDSSRSDVDFLVEFEPLPDGTYADTYFGLLESLEALLQRPVDLVVATAITNPYFRQSVDETKTLVYAA